MRPNETGARDLWAEEEHLFAREGTLRLCGVDEAGAGPLAGAVFAAAVILPRGLVLPGLDDSKRQLPGRMSGRLMRSIFSTRACLPWSEPLPSWTRRRSSP